MTVPQHRPIPVLLVTGFLGSGKTTFLQTLMRRQARRRLVYLVNDFSRLDVDAQWLRQADREVISVPGGSIFCRCLVTEFMAALRNIADTFDTPSAPVEGVVIEASGMTDPRAAGDLLRETGLAHRFELAGVIALVDPGSFHKLLQTLPAVRAQIECADLALINKSDLHGAAALDQTEAALLALQPSLTILRCTRAGVDIEPFTGQSRALRIHGQLAPCRDPDYLSATVTVAPGNPIDARALLACLQAEADILLRAKGVVPTADGLVILQWSLGDATLAPAAQQQRPLAITLIARGSEARRLDRLTDQIRALTRQAAPP